MKLETYLRMSGLPFEIAPNANVMKAPKGKMPYIEDNGHAIADSTLIIEYLKKTYGDKLDAKLSSEQRAIALAMQRLMEENLYWAAVYSRWFEPDGWRLTQQAFLRQAAATCENDSLGSCAARNEARTPRPRHGPSYF